MHDWTLSNALMAKVLAEKATTTSSCSCATPSTSIGRRSRKPCRRRWNGSGRAIRFLSTEVRGMPSARSSRRRWSASGVLGASCVHVVEDLPRQHGGLAGRVEDGLAAGGGEPVGLIGRDRIGGGRVVAAACRKPRGLRARRRVRRSRSVSQQFRGHATSPIWDISPSIWRAWPRRKRIRASGLAFPHGFADLVGFPGLGEPREAALARMRGRFDDDALAHDLPAEHLEFQLVVARHGLAGLRRQQLDTPLDVQRGVAGAMKPRIPAS